MHTVRKGWSWNFPLVCTAASLGPRAQSCSVSEKKSKRGNLFETFSQTRKFSHRKISGQDAQCTPICNHKR